MRQLSAFNPFAASHHSDAISEPGVERAITDGAFKRDVAEWYGLEDADRGMLVDMLGVKRPFSQVTLAHIYPASYTNFGEFASEMSLPGDFNNNYRNFLLLPWHLHEDFDRGYVALIPSTTGIRIRVLRPDRVADATMAMDGRMLHLPGAQHGRVPYKRILGWMAWLARGATLAVTAEVEAEFEAAVVASHSREGNERLESVLRKAALGGVTRARSVT